uniref:CSON008217 protein n=1 Tax=Culicoides sonorensis TaxID=179676 RepID=A0A336JZE9_CULSO
MADVKNLCGFEKLNNHNYSMWAFKMKMLLIKEDLWMTIEGSPPEGVNARELHAKNQKSLSIIALMVENDQVIHIKDCNSGKAAWNILKAFHQQTAMSFKIRIFKRLFKLHLPRGELHDCGATLDNEVIVSIISASLNEEYDPLITAIEAWDSERLTESNVKSKLLDEWSRKKGSNDEVVDVEDVALKVQPKFEFTCYYCQKPGHIKRNCPDYLNHKMNNNNKESAKESR